MRRAGAAAASAALWAASTLSAPAASANLYDLYGFNPRAAAMGGAMTAAAHDFTATFYNPGAMTVDKSARVGAGVIGILPALFVDRAVADPKQPTVLPEPSVGFTLGWIYPMGGVFDDKLALGVSLYLPVGELARVQGLARQAPQFYMFQSMHDKLVFLAAAAFEPWEWLSLGAGIQILADLTGGASLHLDVVDGRFEQREFSVELQPSASLLVGLHVRPVDGLAFGVSWRGQSSISFSLPIHVTEGDALDIRLDVSQTVLWTPHQVSFGLSYDLPSLDLQLAIDATVAFWSAAPDPSPHIRVDIGGRLLDDLGLGDALDLSLHTAPVEMAFVDTVIPRAGFEYKALEWLLLRTGYSFRPTPLPRQSGATAYLDNDAHVVSFGAGLVFQDPLEVHVHPLTVDLAAQATILTRRTVLRTDPGDPIGSLSHGGVVWSLSAAVSHAY